ncbi:glycosyltransferase [Candidatus Thioglobus sp.]|nr:glycosyltransferase [Candidatus Thioglobus sp.]
MKMLFVSSSAPNKVNLMLEAFKSIKSLEIVPEYEKFEADSYYSNKATFIDKIFHKLRIPLDRTNFNDRVYKACVEINPDIIFVVKGNALKSRVVKKIRKKFPHTKLVNWTLDDMFAKHNRSMHYTRSIKYYDLVVTSKSYNCNSDELPSLGAKDVLFQNNGFLPLIHKPCHFCDKVNYSHNVVFIGSAELDRLKFMNAMAASGIVINIYGVGWEKKEFAQYMHHNLIIHHQELRGDSYSEALSCSKISLCFLRKINRDLQTARTVEIPACGGFMLAERTFEHQRMFQEGVEAEYFENIDELIEKTKYYLEDKNNNKRLEIAGNGRIKCLEGGYSLEDRAKEILDNITKRG